MDVMKGDCFAVEINQGWGRGQPVARSSLAASTGDPAEGTAQSRRLPIAFAGHWATAQAVVSEEMTLSGSFHVSASGPKAGLDWVIVRDATRMVQLLSFEKPVPQ